MSADVVADSLAVIDYVYEHILLANNHQPHIPHWRAVDRCFNDHDAAIAHARQRLPMIERRIIEPVELEAAVVPCPLHQWEPPFPTRGGALNGPR